MKYCVGGIGGDGEREVGEQMDGERKRVSDGEKVEGMDRWKEGEKED